MSRKTKRKTGGLYRLDLSHASDGISKNLVPKIIYNEYEVGAFTIDNERKKILLPVAHMNTILAMDFNGRGYYDIRQNCRKSKYYSVESIAFANDLFYWTDVDQIFKKEYYDFDKKYYIECFHGTLNSFQIVRALNKFDLSK